MQVEVIDHKAGEVSGNIELADAAFDQTFNEALVHQIVTAYLAGARAGTHAQKTRSEVRGGGIKPWRQKGTGRARAGSIRSPIWRGGGKVFATKPRDYTQKVNRKMYRGALRAILSELLRQGRLRIFEEFTVPEPKTKELVKKLQTLAADHALIVVAEEDKNLSLAARNLINIRVMTEREINPVCLIKYEQVFFTVPAIKKFEERLA